MRCRKVQEDADRLEHVHRAQDRRGARSSKSCASPAPSAVRSTPRSKCSARTSILEKLKALGEELRFLLIVSQAQVKRVSNAAGPPVGAIKVAEIAKEGGVWIRVQASTAPKCERCWHHRPEVGSNAEHPTICGRCVDNRHRTGRVPDIRMNQDVEAAVHIPVGASGIRWLWISVLVIAVDQLTKLWIERTMVLGDTLRRAAGARHRARAQPGRRLQLPRGRRGLAALGVFVARGRCFDRAGVLAAPARAGHPGAAGIRARADPGRRHRQCHRSRSSTATWSTSCTRTGALRTFPRSTSPMPPSASAPRW